jgi:hypothetical protein
MKNPLKHNNLRFYTLRLCDTPEDAEKVARNFEIRFNKLNKYDQMEMDMVIDLDGWEAAFQKLETYETN